MAGGSTDYRPPPSRNSLVFSHLSHPAWTAAPCLMRSLIVSSRLFNYGGKAPHTNSPVPRSSSRTICCPPPPACLIISSTAPEPYRAATYSGVCPSLARAMAEQAASKRNRITGINGSNEGAAMCSAVSPIASTRPRDSRPRSGGASPRSLGRRVWGVYGCICERRGAGLSG